MSRVTMNPLFDAWAARSEVNTAAQQFILDKASDSQAVIGHFAKLEHTVVGRLMNFGIITAMNAIFMMFHGDLKELPGIGNYSDFNALAMQQNENDWRKVFAIFAWSVGFRPEGDLAPPADCTPELHTHPC
ncbi:MAG: hypothetical protein K2W82_17140 [Candidatus Obscuribacterales bacterium]|nr:hypothetical protein [Candidatus Obscuribacterales bacterium]